MSSADSPAVQDHYPEDFSHCYGCGSLNTHGLQLKSRVEGEEVVARFTPRPEHIALPGFVYGGLLASLVDCHAMATAAGTSERIAGRAVGEATMPRFVTGKLLVEYLKPTPLGPELEIRGRVTEMGERKAIVAVSILANGVQTVRGEVVAVRMPASMAKPPADKSSS